LLGGGGSPCSSEPNEQAEISNAVKTSATTPNREFRHVVM